MKRSETLRECEDHRSPITGLVPIWVESCFSERNEPSHRLLICFCRYMYARNCTVSALTSDLSRAISTNLWATYSWTLPDGCVKIAGSLSNQENASIEPTCARQDHCPGHLCSSSPADQRGSGKDGGNIQ